MAVFNLDLDETERRELEEHRNAKGFRTLADAVRDLIRNRPSVQRLDLGVQLGPSPSKPGSRLKQPAKTRGK